MKATGVLMITIMTIFILWIHLTECEASATMSRQDAVIEKSINRLLKQMTLEEKKTNYEFYQARTIHESFLSPSLHSILALELGKTEQAYQFFTYAARLDLDNYNRNTEQGHYATSAAGVWANLVCGYGGMRSDGTVLSFRPQIARVWNRYQFRVNYQGAVIDVVVD